MQGFSLQRGIHISRPPSYIFRLQIEGLSCGRDDTEFYRFIKKTLFASACVSKTNGYYNSDY
ncbi:hypothetical protein ACS0TY_013782 [Phlomoides rotata]